MPSWDVLRSHSDFMYRMRQKKRETEKFSSNFTSQHTFWLSAFYELNSYDNDH